MGGEPFGAAIILAISQPHSPIDDRHLVRRLARPLLERIIARRFHPMAFVHEPGDPSGVDRRVGDAHADHPSAMQRWSGGADTVLSWPTGSRSASVADLTLASLKQAVRAHLAHG
jgi:hypothetical protein